jgi:hypothetical protein
MRWDCNERGCFNIKKRPKIEVFSECFSNGINFGDVDGLVERRGRFLLLEWKSTNHVPTGQRRLHDAILKDERWAIVFVCGDPELMTVDSFEIRYGAGRPRRGCSMDELMEQVRRWYAWADAGGKAA